MVSENYYLAPIKREKIMREGDLADDALFRQMAEEELAKRHSLEQTNKPIHIGFCKTIEEHRANIHELEVCKLVLEMQYQELQKAIERVASATALYELSPAGYYTLERDGRIGELNINGARLLGKNRQELTGRCFSDYLSEDMKDTFQDFIKNVFESGIRQTCEITLHVNGDADLYIYLEGFIAENKLQCLLTAIDITERKLSEQAIRTSETRLKQAEIISKTGNWELHLDTQRIYASDGAYKIYGVNKGDFSFDSIKNIPLPEYRSLLDSRMLQLIEMNVHYEVEFKIKSVDTGEIKDIRSIATFDKEKRMVFGVVQDITEQKTMEQRIHESEQYYRSMVEASPDAIVIVDTNGLLQFASHKAYEIFNIPADYPVKGSPLVGWVAPEMREPTMLRFHKIVTEQIPSEPFEYKIQLLDGSTIWTEIHGSILKDINGTVEGLFLICRNVSERKYAEEAVQHAHDELKNLHDNLDEAIFSFDLLNNKILQASKAHEDIFGYPPCEFYRNPKLWYELVIPEDKPVVDAGLHVVHSGNAHQHEFRIIRPDGQLRWISSRMQPKMNLLGQCIQVDGMAFDITERKMAEEEIRETEERFRMVFENVFDGIAIYEENDDPFKRKLIECNNQYALMAGMPREELLALGFVHHLQVSLDKTNNPVRLESLAHQKAYKGSSSWIRPDGRENVIEYIGVPITWRGKAYSIGIDRDVTERVQIEADLIAAKEKAEESDRLKSSFLANMSHEIRTPLNSIIGFSDLMSDPDFDHDDQHQFAQIIHSCGNNLLSIITDIMDISKIEAGLVEVRKNDLSVSNLVKSIHRQYSFQAKEKGIELMLDPDLPSDEIILSTDETKLRQIIVNLVGNSLKFTEKGFIELGMRKTQHALQFHVKDTGIGISSEHRDKIFERFRQVESCLTRRFGGNGLGLAISKSLVELLGGKLWMESEEGKGSTFYFTLPLEETSSISR